MGPHPAQLLRGPPPRAGSALVKGAHDGQRGWRLEEVCDALKGDTRIVHLAQGVLEFAQMPPVALGCVGAERRVEGFI